MGKARGRLGKGRGKIVVEVDRAMKRRYDELVEAISRTTREGSSAFDERYEAIGEIIESDPPLWVAGGYSTVQAFLAGVVKEPERSVRRMVRVARFASPAEETRHGVAKLDAGLAYVEAKTAGTIKERLPIDWRALRVPVRRSGKNRRVLFAAATIDELHAAARALRKPPRKPKDALVTRLDAALRAAGLGAVRAHAAAGHVTLSGIGRADLAKLGRVLAGLRASGDE